MTFSSAQLPTNQYGTFTEDQSNMIANICDCTAVSLAFSAQCSDGSCCLSK